jgi:hypothetical protein
MKQRKRIASLTYYTSVEFIEFVGFVEVVEVFLARVETRQKKRVKLTL